MYAIIRTGGKQAKVSQGDVIDVERLKESGDSVEFTPLLVVDDKGNTITDRTALSGIKVKAEILGDTKGDKIDIFKYKNKSGYRRRMGHRQIYTSIEITEITLPKKAAKAKKAADDKEAPKAKKSAETKKTTKAAKGEED